MPGKKDWFAKLERLKSNVAAKKSSKPSSPDTSQPSPAEASKQTSNRSPIEAPKPSLPQSPKQTSHRSPTEAPKPPLPEAPKEPSQPSPAEAPKPSPGEVQLSKKVFCINRKTYHVFNEIGKGGSCKVYEARLGSDTVAIKVVDLEDLPKEVRDGYFKEIDYLERFKEHPEIIAMHSWEEKNEATGLKLYIVMEKASNDFQNFLHSSNRSPNMIRYYWESMLHCVKVIHDKNIVHSDLKPANFLIVNGKLKLCDFGIASHIDPDQTSIAKDSQAGTLNYMSPESIQIRSKDNKVHIPLTSDVWSLGCILYNMVYGTTPFAHVPNQLKKMHAIVHDPIRFDDIDDQLLLDVLKLCLQRDIRRRPTVNQLLEHSYVTNKPNTSSFSTSGFARTPSAMVLDDSVEESPRTLAKIEDVVRNYTPKTSTKKIAKMIRNAHGATINSTTSSQ